MRVPRWALLAIVGIAALLVLGRALAGAYVDERWYAAMGARALWRERALLVALLRSASGLVASLFVFANLYAVRHSVVSLVVPRRMGNLEIGEEVPSRYLLVATIVLALLIGALLTLPASAWSSLALVRHGVPFGEADPYYEADLGFYVYWLPFENALYVWALIAILVVTAIVVTLYALTPSLRWERGTLHVSHYVRRHLVVLGSLMLLLLAWSYRLDGYRVLMHGSGPDGAFTFADHHAAIPVSLWLSIITTAAAVAVLFFGWTEQIRMAFAAVTIVLVLTVVLRNGTPPLVRHFASVADPAAREQPYRQIRAEYTRRAYALDHVQRGDSVGYATPHDAVDALAVWEPAALERSLTQLRWLEGVPRGIGWSASPAGLLAVVIDGPGEGALGTGLEGSGAPAGAATGATSSGARDGSAVRDGSGARVAWGATRLRAAGADPAGDPVAVDLTDAPPDEQALPPVLIFNSLTGYAIIADSAGTVVAPTLGGTLSRLAYAWTLQNPRLLSGDLAPEGSGRRDGPLVRVLTRRGVRDRVRALTPFFVQGTTVLPTIAADSLYWVVELYAASDDYPLSERALLGADEFGYVHHAATAIVNAHTGRVTVLADAAPDPVTQSWMRAFPALFRDGGALPSALLSLLPPEIDAAHVQALELARYGLPSRPGAGTERPPLGHLPWNTGADSLLRGGELTMFQLPSAALAWSQPVLDSADRVAGVVVAVGGHDGKTYWVPMDHPGFRWNSLVDQMRRTADTTARSTGSTRSGRDTPRLVHGAITAVPLAGSVTMVQPAYAWPPDAPPVLAGVVVARDSSAVAGRTLGEALGVLPAPPRRDTSAVRSRDFRTLVARLYTQMRTALERGDWAAFGRAYDALGALLARPEGRP